MIYFDHNATTPLLPQAKEVMDSAAKNFWGNPSSVHSVGRMAFAELERARQRLADLINATPEELFFTSGGTESDNLAITGIMDQFPKKEMVCSAIEHPAVSETAMQLAAKGRVCRVAGVDSSGILNLEEFFDTVNDNTGLVSVMAASNEIGTLQPIDQIGDFLSKKETLFHCDAVQALGKIPVDVERSKIDLLSLSSHKVNGPKGVGALYVRKGVSPKPLFCGGYQERRLRPGTQNLPAILGFVEAAEISCSTIAKTAEHLRNLTHHLYSGIAANIKDVIRNGDAEKRTPGTLNISFCGVETQVLVAALDGEGICVSGGSACHSGSIDPSAVLLAIARRYQDAACAVRFSLGFSNTMEEVDRCIETLVRVVKRIRGLN